MRVHSRKQEGFVLVVVAAVLVIMVGFVALGVDVGVLYSARTSAQGIADAAALAGAFTFISQPLALQPTTAQNHAMEVALANSILGAPITPANVSVSVNTTNQTVTVNLTSTQNTYFAKAIGIGTATANVGVQAIAEAALQTSAAGPCFIKPWFIPNTALSTQLPCAACTSSEVITTGGAPTSYALARLGQQILVKPQNPQQALQPGNFYALRFPGSNGANDYEANIAGNCTSDPPVILQCNDNYFVEPGNMVGKTRSGVDSLIGAPPTDLFHGVGLYGPSGGPFSDVSRALVVAPIWDTCGGGYCPSESLPGGSNANVTVIGFAVIFLEGTQGNGNNANVVGRLINVSSCPPGGSGGGGSTGSTGSGTFPTPLRLVRP